MLIYFSGISIPLTLLSLSADKGFDESVSGLCVQTESVSERLQLGTLVQKGFLQALAAGVEVLLDGVQGHVQHGTLLRGKVLLCFFRHVLQVEYMHLFKSSCAFE